MNFGIDAEVAAAEAPPARSPTPETVPAASPSPTTPAAASPAAAAGGFGIDAEVAAVAAPSPKPGFFSSMYEAPAAAPASPAAAPASPAAALEPAAAAATSPAPATTTSPKPGGFFSSMYENPAATPEPAGPAKDVGLAAEVDAEKSFGLRAEVAATEATEAPPVVAVASPADASLAAAAAASSSPAAAAAAPTGVDPWAARPADAATAGSESTPAAAPAVAPAPFSSPIASESAAASTAAVPGSPAAISDAPAAAAAVSTPPASPSRAIPATSTGKPPPSPERTSRQQNALAMAIKKVSDAPSSDAAPKTAAQVEKATSFITALRDAAPSTPARTRPLSKADALSIRVHSTSPLVPHAVLLNPVIRVHLLDAETGLIINPSGLATTPLQSAPFDLSRRIKSAFAAEWEETMDVEEELGGLLHARAVLLFELLQPPPSFSYYEERPELFPNGNPHRIAWGFLKLIRTKDDQPNLGRLQLQLYKYGREPVGAGGGLRKSFSRGGGGGGNADALEESAGPQPEVWHCYKAVTRMQPNQRPLYPAHVNVTIASAPRGDAATALLAASAAAAPTMRPLAIGPAVPSSSGGEARAAGGRPTRRERIVRERTLGGGWQTAEQRLASAPPEDMMEVAQSLGRVPYETLCYGMDPAAAHAHALASIGAEDGSMTAAIAGSALKRGAGSIVSPSRDDQPAVVAKLPYAIAEHDECEIPNVAARTQATLPTSAREVLLTAFDSTGRRLAAVCREGSMCTLRVFDAATGELRQTFPGHCAAVHDVSWAPTIEDDDDDAAAAAPSPTRGAVDYASAGAPTRVMTASADGAATAWAVGGGPDAIAQHACECFAAQWHPTTRDVCATGARDGGIRLWLVPPANRGGGDAKVLASVAPGRGAACTALAFDKAGARLYAGFHDGSVRELILDLGVDAGAKKSPYSARELAPRSLMRPLRECKDTMGEAITCVRVAPNNRRVLTRTLADRVVSMDLTYFAATHSFDCGRDDRKAKASSTTERVAANATATANDGASFKHPGASMRFALSPDGRFVAAGSRDGTARVFDVDVPGKGVPFAAAEDPNALGVAVNDVAWSPAAHVVAIAGAHGSRGLRLAAYQDGRKPVARPPRPEAIIMGRPTSLASAKKTREASGLGALQRPPRSELPPRLTPDAVRDILHRVRVDSRLDRAEFTSEYRRSRTGTTPRGSAYERLGRGSSGGGGGGDVAAEAPARDPVKAAEDARVMAAYQMQETSEKENNVRVGGRATAAAAAAAAGAGAGAGAKFDPYSPDVPAGGKTATTGGGFGSPTVVGEDTSADASALEKMLYGSGGA